MPTMCVEPRAHATLSARRAGNRLCAQAWWMQHREAAFNWIALGLLLAAWNASDNDAVNRARRPEALRGYAAVSARAVQRAAALAP